MNQSKLSSMERNIQSVSRRNLRAWIFCALSLAVAFCTVYLLMRPAITQEAETFCGMEEHLHTEECYEPVPVLTCGEAEAEAHTHTDSCYSTETVLICTGEETDGHTHEDTCFETVNSCICGLDETEPHHHTDSCYTDQEALVCSLPEDENHTHGESCYGTECVLTCELTETDGHTHSEACFEAVTECVCGQTEGFAYHHNESCYQAETVLICDVVEGEGHVHAEACYTRQLTCTEEEHVHSLACYSNRNADLESESDWERTIKKVQLTGIWADDVVAVAATQLGYAESTANYIVDENGEIKGYTRYGAWYGNAYGDWCAMFVSFCLHYADIPSDAFPYDSNCGSWLRKLNGEARGYDFDLYHTREEVLEGKYEIKPGDLVFFCREDGKSAAHIGLVKEVKTDENGKIIAFTTIEGNSGNAVNQKNYNSDSKYILGFGELPENSASKGTTTDTETSSDETGTVNGVEQHPKSQTVEGADYTITVTYSNELIIPEDAELRAEEYDKDSEIYQKRYAEAAELYGWGSDVDNTASFRLFNIGFYVNGEELELSGAVDVNITYKNDGAAAAGYQVTHYTDNETQDMEVSVSAENGEIAIEFSTDGFSDYSTLLLGDTSTSSDTHPTCAVPGSVSVNHQLLYSIDASGSDITYVAGAQYTIYHSDGSVYNTFTAGDSLNIDVGSLPAGTYTISQTYVPDGYVLVPQTREFTVVTGVYTNIGVFYVYKNGDDVSKTDKTAQVVDYVNRTYQVDLSAVSGIYTYDFKTLNYSIVVDQSNSMLFPAELKSTGKTVTLKSGTNITANNTNLNNAGLDKNKVYYIIADESNTSTVYAIFYDSVNNGWCYQDAAYYAKAQFNERGIYTNLAAEGDVTVVYAKSTNTTYSASYTENNISYQATGGASICYLGGTLSKEATDAGKAYTIYTGSEYDRLHELQEAVSGFAQELAALSPDSTLDIVTFDKEVESCVENIKMNPAGVTEVVDVVNHITTSGGTRQDRALYHLINQHGGNDTANHTKSHLSSGDIVILITDGAPVNSKGDTGAGVDTNKTAATAVKNAGGQLITIGLSTKNVVGGSDALDIMASTTIYDVSSGSADSKQGSWFFDATKTGQLTDIMVNNVLFKLAEKSYSISSANIKDIISDSFYPIDPDTNQPLTDGARIALDGTLSSDGPGTVHYDSDRKEWYVVWNNQTMGTGTAASPTKTVYTYTDGAGNSQVIDPSVIYYINFYSNYAISGTGSDDTSKDRLLYRDGAWIYAWRDTTYRQNYTSSAASRVTAQTIEGTEGSPAWHGRIYLKAKEDFIGGNTIDTNKTAQITLLDTDGQKTGNILQLSTPTVNVRLLELKGFESEETVFLGDSVSDLREKLQTLLDKTVFEKLVSGEGNNLNYKTWKDTTEGCPADTFSIPYAIRDLTDDEWVSLMNGSSVKIDYTYDSGSSHGAVGYFTFTLSKTGATADYADHRTTVSGENVDQYILSVTYTAYGIGEKDDAGIERKADVHNGSGGPGTEVGKGDTIPTGAGTESVEEIHHVYVVDGEFFVTKVIDNTLKSDVDQTYLFNLYTFDSITGEVEETAYRSVTATVKAGETTATIRIDNLPRNTYILREAASEDYLVEKVTVVADNTTCSYSTESAALKFEIGTNISSSGSNPDHNVILYNDTLPTYEQSVWADGERYVYSKPFSSAYTQDSSARAENTEASSVTGTRKKTVEVETYAWSGGTIISTSTSGSEYQKLDRTAASLDAAHTSYGILTQDTNDEDVWTVEWHIWSSEEKAAKTYDWPSGTIISTSTSGNTYSALSSTATRLDASHTSYGILKQDSDDPNQWTVEWHIWTSKQEEVSDGSTTTTYNPLTISYYQNNVPDLSQYANSDYYYKNEESGAYELITNIRSDGYNLIITTAGVTNKYVPVTSEWKNNNNYISYDIYQATTGGTTITTVWSVAIDTVTADSGKIPSTTGTTAAWTVQIDKEAADSSKIPKTTETVILDVPEDSPEAETETGEAVSSVLVTKLSAGHGAIYNTKATYEGEIAVQKNWDDGKAHSGDEVFVVLVDSTGCPITDENGIAMMLRLTEDNSWQSVFIVSIPSKNYDPLQDGYQIREVKTKQIDSFNQGIQAKLVNDASDSVVYYVKIADEADFITINGSSYTVHYTTTANKLVATNSKAYELPEAGGSGTSSYTMGGIALILTSFVLFTRRSRRKRERRVQ